MPILLLSASRMKECLVLVQEKSLLLNQEQPPSLAFVDSCRATIQEDGPSFALAVVVSVCGSSLRFE